jgi:ABC-type glycerol-3-phosphate transport system substrate-binding protein
MAACQPQAAATPEETMAPTEQESQPSEKVTLKFWRYIEENKEEKALIEEYAKKYSEVNPNVTVEVSFIPWEQYTGEKLISGIASGEGPDVFWLAPPGMIPFVDSDVLLPLEDYLPADVKSDFRQETLDAVTFNNHLYALPNEQELLAIFYNKKLFEEEGLQPPKTWDELIETARKLTTPDRYGMELETAPDGYFIFTFYPFLWAAGGRTLNDDWTKSEINSPAAVSAFDLWQTLFKEKLVPPSHVDPSWYVDNLAQGKVAMSLNGSWAVSMLKSQYPDFEYGVAPIPVPEGGQPSTAYGGWTTVVNKNSPHVKEAVDFVMWLYANEDPTFSYKWSFDANFKWPVRKSVMEMAKPLLDQWPYSVFRDEIEPYGKPEAAFPPEVGNALIDALQAAIFKDVTPEETAQKAADTIDEFLADYTGTKSPSH